MDLGSAVNRFVLAITGICLVALTTLEATAQVEVLFDLESLIVSPEQPIGMQVGVDSDVLRADTRVRATAVLRSADGGDEHWRDKQDQRVDLRQQILQLQPFQVIAPKQMGVYKLEVWVDELSKLTRRKTTSIDHIVYDVVVVGDADQSQLNSGIQKTPRLLVSSYDGARLRRALGLNDDQGSLMIEWPVLYQKIDEWIQRMAQQGYNAVALPADISGIPLEAIAAAPDRPDARSDVTYDLLELLLRKFDQQGFKSFVFIESINDDAVGSQASVGYRSSASGLRSCGKITFSPYVLTSSGINFPTGWEIRCKL